MNKQPNKDNIMSLFPLSEGGRDPNYDVRHSIAQMRNEGSRISSAFSPSKKALPAEDRYSVSIFEAGRQIARLTQFIAK